MDEGRKRVLLIAAAILAARKLGAVRSRKASSAVCAIVDAVRWVPQILDEIERRWPEKDSGSVRGKSTRRVTPHGVEYGKNKSVRPSFSRSPWDVCGARERTG